MVANPLLRIQDDENTKITLSIKEYKRIINFVESENSSSEDTAKIKALELLVLELLNGKPLVQAARNVRQQHFIDIVIKHLPTYKGYSFKYINC